MFSVWAFLLCSSLAALSYGARLTNELISVDVLAAGLTNFTDFQINQTWHFTGDYFAVDFEGGRSLNPTTLGAAPTVILSADKAVVELLYANVGAVVSVLYELQPGWRFVSKVTRHHPHTAI